MSAGRGAPSSCRTVVSEEVAIAVEAAVSENPFCPQSLLNLPYLDVPGVGLVEALRVGKEKKRVTPLGTRRPPSFGSGKPYNVKYGRVS